MRASSPRKGLVPLPGGSWDMKPLDGLNCLLIIRLISGRMLVRSRHKPQHLPSAAAPSLRSKALRCLQSLAPRGRFGEKKEKSLTERMQIEAALSTHNTSTYLFKCAPFPVLPAPRNQGRISSSTAVNRIILGI